MKKLLLFALLLPVFCKAQIEGATTQEEYNYLTIGLPDLLSKGLPPRSDYYFIPWQSQPSFNYTTTFGGTETYNFQFLMRHNDKKFCAVLMTVTVPGKIYNFCLPAPYTQPDIIEECKQVLMRQLSTGEDRTFRLMWTLLLQRLNAEYNMM